VQVSNGSPEEDNQSHNPHRSTSGCGEALAESSAVSTLRRQAAVRNFSDGLAELVPMSPGAFSSEVRVKKTPQTKK
jgi:hypothetical protein